MEEVNQQPFPLALFVNSANANVDNIDSKIDRHNITSLHVSKDDEPEICASAKTGIKRKYWDTNEDEDTLNSVSVCETEQLNEASSPSDATTQSKTLVPSKQDRQHEMCCEWRSCDHKTCNIDDFIRHVSQHIPHLEIREDHQKEEIYGCLWHGCLFETADPSEVTRHVNFHAYHTKIKSIGKGLIDRTPGLNTCTLGSIQQNEVPELPEPFICNWDKCETIFSNIQLYFFHVRAHIERLKQVNNPITNVSCQWANCSSSFRLLYRLSDHMRTHTQERCIACPTCGGFFASSTKLIDHIKRQTNVAGLSFQCSHCSKYFSSERLLRDHMRHHVNHYKCTFCDMTCPTPSCLSLHIRYKHLQDKPFQCQSCPYKTKTKQDLAVHMDSHSDMVYECTEKGCDFKCRSSYGMRKHERKIHGEDDPLYCCHLCNARFLRGSYLTKHLFKLHDIRWPNGHCRFRYKVDDQGLYHLETVRYESLEVSQEMMRAESLTNHQSDGGIIGGMHGRSKNVHITIAQLDESGNIIEENIVETEEIMTLPVGGTTIMM